MAGNVTEFTLEGNGSSYRSSYRRYRGDNYADDSTGYGVASFFNRTPYSAGNYFCGFRVYLYIK